MTKGKWCFFLPLNKVWFLGKVGIGGYHLDSQCFRHLKCNLWPKIHKQRTCNAPCYKHQRLWFESHQEGPKDPGKKEKTAEITPLKTDMEPQNEGLEDDSPFKMGDCQVRSLSGSGEVSTLGAGVFVFQTWRPGRCRDFRWTSRFEVSLIRTMGIE